MRAATVVLSLLTLLPACASLREPSDYETYADEMDVRRPLRARIVSSGSLGVQLNRPAYAAVFEIIPGRGVGLVYPSSGASSGYLTSGFSNLWMRSSFYRTAYLDDPLGYSSQGPRYYYLIASDEPLRVDEFAHSPMALRSMLGFQSFASWNPYALMDDLADRVLPNVPEGNWDSDLYVVWPESRQRGRTGRQLVAVRCQGGSTFYVPAVYVRQVCANSLGRSDSPRAGALRSRPVRNEPTERPARPARPNADAADRTNRQIERRELDRPERPSRNTAGDAQRERPERAERPAREENAEVRRERPEVQRRERPERVERPQRRSEPRPEVRPERVEPSSEPRTEPRAETRRPEREPVP